MNKNRKLGIIVLLIGIVVIGMVLIRPAPQSILWESYYTQATFTFSKEPTKVPTSVPKMEKELCVFKNNVKKKKKLLNLIIDKITTPKTCSIAIKLKISPPHITIYTCPIIKLKETIMIETTPELIK